MMKLLSCAFFILAGMLPLTVGAQVLERVSVDGGGADANGDSEAPEINADGQFVAFSSGATDLVSGDGNGRIDVFVRDRSGNVTTLISRDVDGLDSDDHSTFPDLSHNGEFVGFASTATDLVNGDGNAASDIFVRNRQATTTTRVSVDSNGVEADGFSAATSISGDGLFVAFLSAATNLLGAGVDTNGLSDIFVHDTQTGATTRVSVDSDGNQGSGGGGNTMDPQLSTDGRFVAFASDMTDLVAGDANGNTDIFLHDRQAGTTSLVSVATDGTQGSSNAEDLALSSDGRYVAFRSGANNLLGAGNDTNAAVDIFVRDTQTDTTTRVSIDSNGAESDGDSFGPSLSGDGRFVAFESTAQNLLGAGNDTNGQRDIFVHDRDTAQTVRVSVRADGTEGDGASRIAAISDDGHIVTFQSDAANLVDGDGNGATDIFVASNPLRPPFTGTVNDGSGADIDVQNSTTTIEANWPGFMAAASAITSFEWAIGNSAGATDVQDFTDVGTSTSQSNNSLSLMDGSRYFVSVRATDANGNVSEVSTSNGVTIDTTAAPDSGSGTGSGGGSGSGSGGCSLNSES